MIASRRAIRLSGPRILLCSADVGCGHGRAALAVSLSLRSACPGIQTNIVDALESAPPWFNLVYRELYFFATQHLPRLNGWLYDRTDIQGTPSHRGFAPMVESRAMKTFCNSAQVRQADLIVCTHFLCARVLSALRGRGELKARLAVIVTDQHPHAVWRVPHADLYMVASQTAAEEMARHGIAPDRVVVTGIPIDARFSNPMPKAAARAKQNLPLESPIILLSGGGLGLGGIDRALDGILSAGREIFTVVVCGRNEKLHAQLLNRVGSDSSRCRILGITSRMHELMAAADLLVGKPGGLTTAEGTAVGLPMVLLRPIPGQEERNAGLLVKAGAAILHENPFDAGQAAANLVEQTQVLSEMKRNAQRFGRGNSAHAAAIAALALCPGHASASTPTAFSFERSADTSDLVPTRSAN